MKPRRGLPPEPELPDYGETELELSAVRRGLPLADIPAAGAVRGPSRAAPEDEADLAKVDLAPRRPSRALPIEAAEPAEAPPVSDPPAPPAPPAEPAADQPRPGRSWAAAVIAITLAGLGLAIGVGVLPGVQAPIPETVPLVTAMSLTCPVAENHPATLVAAATDGEIGFRQIGNSESTTQSGVLRLADQTTPAVVTPQNLQASVTAGALIGTDNHQWWGGCRAPLADQYVQLPGGAGAKLLIVNSEPSDALIDITLSGPNGEITGDGLRGVTIAANSRQLIDLAPLGGEVNALGARIRSSLGRVMVAAQISRDGGADFATSTVQSRELVIAAIPGEVTSTQLLLTNPGTSRNVVSIEAVSQAGRYQLPGFESFALDAQRTVAVDLTGAIDGLPVSLLISGRDQFAATAVVTAGSDFGIEPAQIDEQSVATQELVSVVPGRGALQIANPGSGEALVVIDWGTGQATANRTIAAGSIASIDIPEGAETVRVSSTAPIAAALLLRGSDRPGFTIAELYPAARSRASTPMEVDAGLGR